MQEESSSPLSILLYPTVCLFKLNHSSNMAVSARGARGILACVLGPAEQHLRPTVRDIIIAEVARMNSSSIEVAHRRRGRLVEDMLLRPRVLDQVLAVVRIRVSARSVRRHNSTWRLEVAVIEGIVCVAGEVDSNKGSVVRRVEDVDVHDLGGIGEEDRGRRTEYHPAGPVRPIPVGVLRAVDNRGWIGACEQEPGTCQAEQVDSSVCAANTGGTPGADAADRAPLDFVL